MIEIAYLTTRNQKTAKKLVQLIQAIGSASLTFSQLQNNTDIKPCYLSFLITKLRSIEILRGHKDHNGAYRYYLPHDSFSTWAKTKLFDASYNLCKRGGDTRG